MFRLQELYCQREKRRFEHLLAADELRSRVQWASLDSLTAISKTVESQWNDQQEAALREANPDFNSAEGHLLYARSLELQGKTEQALREYAALVAYYPGQEARCRFGLLLGQSGRGTEARKLFEEVCQSIDYGPRHQRRDQREWYDLARRQLAS